MKPKYRLHSKCATLNLGLSISLVLSLLPRAHAADGTWTKDGSSDWSITTNWLDGIVADGADSTADFSTIDITASRTVQLDSPRTLGNLVFGDSNTAGFASWTLGNDGNPSNILTMAVNAGSPTITVNTATRISAIIDGTDGLAKAGTGTLVLNQANTYTGATRISGGTLQISGSGTLGNQGDLIAEWDGSLDLGGSTQTLGAVQFGYGSITNGNLVATSYVLDGGHHTAGLGGEGASLYMNDAYVFLEGVNTYTGTTTIDRTKLGLKKSASLYNADTSKWTKEKISAFGDGGGVIVSVGGTGEFTTAQAKTLLGNLTTSIDNNGLTAGTSFGIDTSNSSGPVVFDQVIADSSGNGAGVLHLTVEGLQALVLNQANTYSGNTALIGGHLKVGHANAIPSGVGKGVVTTQAWTAGDSQMDINGFDVSINALAGDGAIIVNNAVGTDQKITLGSNDPAHSGNWFSGQIADNSGTGGTLSFDKIGSSTQVLSGNNTYTGATTVRAGNLVVNGSISTSILTTVESGATLSGSGFVGALTVEAGGRIAPGNSPGILSTGDYNQAGTLSLEINGTATGSEYDQVNVTGTVTLSGMLTLTMTDFTPAAGNLFFVINNDGTDAISGTFSGLAQGAEFTMDGWLWSISYDANFGSNTFDSGNDVALRSLAAIPEPSTVVLGGLGLLALLRRRRA